MCNKYKQIFSELKKDIPKCRDRNQPNIVCGNLKGESNAVNNIINKSKNNKEPIVLQSDSSPVSEPRSSK